MTRTMANSGGSPGGISQGLGGAAAASTPSGSGIPAHVRKTVMSIKEIVEHSEEEICAVYMECGMDVDETVQRLLNQDAFQEVKRRRDRKREVNKTGSDSKPAGRGSGGRGGRYGRGNFNPNGSGRGRGAPRHNGYYKSSSVQEAPPSSTAPTTPASSGTQPSNLVPVQNGPVHLRSAPAPGAPFVEVLKSNGLGEQPAKATVPNGPVAGKVGGNNRGGQQASNEAERPASRLDQIPDTQALNAGVSSASAATVPRANKLQPPVGTQRTTGPAQEWKAKAKPKPAPVVPPVVNAEESSPADKPKRSSSPTSPQEKLQEQASEKDERPVIIHSQFLVPADLGLSFGSLNFGGEDELQPEPKSSTSEDVEPVEEADNRPSSSPEQGSLDQNYGLEQASDSLPSNSEVASVTIAVVSQPEASRPESVQNSHYPYLPAYSGFGLVAQPGTQYAYESADSQLSDGSRFSTLHQQYSDPAPSYYTPSYRPSGEGDSRYQSVATKGRYSGSVSTVAAASTESGNASSSLTQTSQPSGQSLPNVPHQPVPLHAAYSAQPGLHLGYNMFNYPYMPQPYMHPYQSFAGSNAYPQPPTGNNYPPTNSYPSTNNYPSAAGKYPVTQFKPAAATANTTTAGGYAGYTSTPAGYATNPTVTMGTGSYDDVGASQYKDNVYLQSQQQAEGSQMWLRDSYYNMPGQSHTYAHAYGSLYHPTQSVPAPNSHQILQQPQGVATGGSQGTAYAQQPQRAQQTWSNTY